MLNLFTLASSLGLALAGANVTLVVEGQNVVNGSGVTNIHFGAGINGALISSSPVTYDFNITDLTVFQEIEIADGPIPFVLGEQFNELTSIAGGAKIPATVDCCGYLSVNGSSSVFYACDKLSWDPYNYVSSKQRGIGIFGESEQVPSYCNEIKIKVVNTN